MKKLLTICAVAGLIMAVAGTAQADLDVNAIYISYVKDYVDGTEIINPWGFEIWVEFAGSFDHIDVTPPAGAPPFIIPGDDYWDWGYANIGSVQTPYPEGIYTLEFQESGHTLIDTAILDNSGLSNPDSPVSFNYPIDNSTTPTFTWTVDLGDGDALGMWVLDPVADEDIYENGPVSMGTLDWTPGSLDPNTYELEVSVFKVKDGLPGPLLPSKDTVGGDPFYYGLMIDYINATEFTTVPEPATIALLGLGGLLLRKRRDRKQSKK